jgi:hypothetical protein
LTARWCCHEVCWRNSRALMPLPTTGVAGEHYVTYRLLRRGLIAALAPTGVPNADIIVTDDIGDKVCAVQVKTRLSPGGMAVCGNIPLTDFRASKSFLAVRAGCACRGRWPGRWCKIRYDAEARIRASL